MRPVDALAVLGTLCGFYYFALGLSAGSYLNDQVRANSPGERFLLTNFLWSLTPGQFSDEGRRICKKANWVAVLAFTAWVSWAALK
jgi:predicted branched-subunit amino acid permease